MCSKWSLQIGTLHSRLHAFFLVVFEQIWMGDYNLQGHQTQHLRFIVGKAASQICILIMWNENTTLYQKHVYQMERESHSIHRYRL